MKRRISVAVLLVGLAIPAAAQAAPSMSIDHIVSPTGQAATSGVWRTDDHTSWHVGLRGIGAWDETECSSTATYTAWGDVGEDYTDTVEGEDANPNGPWNSYSFKAETPTDYADNADWSYDFVPLAHIRATCELTRTRYVGRRYYRSGLTLHKNGPQTHRRLPNGCKIYSYSVGALTIDCLTSRSSGAATWSFKVRRTDRVRRAWLFFDTSRSTMGAHPMTVRRRGNYVNVTETVSPGTMITVTDVEVPVSRRYSREVWRDDSKTLTASWPS
jgi:hypothetical protein